jgi:KaiC/GvpD/RAD55 family RecA-like ATPase
VRIRTVAGFFRLPLSERDMDGDPESVTDLDPTPETERRPHRETAVPTGVDLLDSMLDGGLPRERSTLVVGGPGTGKSTLAMSFLQDGLDRGEDCLYVSTEQTIEELRDGFAPYEFDLDDHRLTYTSVHARPGRTIEDDETITLQTLSEEGTVGEGFAAPFETRYIRDHLQQFAPCDRVVFDSVSGLATVAEDPGLFRRSVLDLIRLFTDDFGATTVFTAEETEGTAAPATPLRFTTHGVLRLTRERVADDRHRFLSIEKMRGVDHDRRTVEFEFVDSGIDAAPTRRSQPPALKQHRHAPVGIDGLDALTGGGPVLGAGVLLEHDGRANLSALLSAVVAAALDREDAVTLVPPTGLGPERLDSLLTGHGHDLDAAMADRRLFVLDAVGAWDAGRDGVYSVYGSLDAVTDTIEAVDARATADDRLTLVDTSLLTHRLGADAARDLRYLLGGRLTGGDGLVTVSNRGVVADDVHEFHVGAAAQVLRTWLTDEGLQYVSLEKSPCGFVGSTSLVEFRTDAPYINVQAPPRSRENPMSGPPN